MKKSMIWIGAIALILAGAVGVSMVLPAMTQKPVAVYPVNMISYTGSFTSSGQSTGVVTTDKVQTLYVSDTQTVTKLYVSTGDTVKKGQLLYTYDTTLTDLVLDRKELAIEQLELNLKTAKEDLQKLKAMKPMVVTTPTVAEKGKSPANAGLLGTRYSGSGTQKDPFLFWMVDGAVLDQEFIWTQFLNGKEAGDKIYVIFQTTQDNKANTEFKSQFGVIFAIPKQETPPQETDPTDPTTDPTEPDPGGSTGTADPDSGTQPATDPVEDPMPITEPDPSEESQPEEPTEPEPEQVFTIAFFDPDDEEIGTQIDWNSGYTQAELTTMRNEKSEEIKQLEFSIKMSKAELEIMKKEAADGKVCADFDGVVVGVLDPNDAQSLELPLMKITGGGGYYIQGTVSELDREKLTIGQSVAVYCWDTGDRYTGTVSAIGSYPSENGDYQYGAVNVTYYPYTVFVDDSADLQEGTYVSLTYELGTEDNALYLENAFILTEGKDSFVYIRNEQGLIEKRLILTGVSTDGYATPVYSGVTAADYIAFPYDQNLREGAETVQSGLDGLYGY